VSDEETLEQMQRQINAASSELDPHQSRQVRPLEEAMANLKETLGSEIPSSLIDAARMIGQSDDGQQTTVWAPAAAGFTPSPAWIKEAFLAARAKRVEEIQQHAAAVAAASQHAAAQVQAFAAAFGGGFWEVEPANKANRRTFHIGGRKKFFVEHNGQLVLQDAVSPWS